MYCMEAEKVEKLCRIEKSRMGLSHEGEQEEGGPHFLEAESGLLREGFGARRSAKPCGKTALRHCFLLGGKLPLIDAHTIHF